MGKKIAERKRQTVVDTIGLLSRTVIQAGDSIVLETVGIRRSNFFGFLCLRSGVTSFRRRIFSIVFASEFGLNFAQPRISGILYYSSIN
jgi:hypothetical protein